ncbi:hypothetical protein [Empedobacter tilapiae]
MIQSIRLNEIIVEYDKEKTSDAYINEINIKEDCPCGDCHFFVDVILKIDLEIFRFLKSVGTDLEKNLKNEPTGVWCIRDDDNDFVFFQQVYLIKGILSSNSSSHYEKEELGLKIDAEFINKDDNIIVDLKVGKVNLV